jgi:hypothetical protein
VRTVFYTGLKSKPHLACPLIEAIMPDKRIRRAELLSILRLIKSAMKQAIGTNINRPPHDLSGKPYFIVPGITLLTTNT